MYRYLMQFFVSMLLLLPQYAQAKQFREIIAFGDSLTDVGNVAGLTFPGYSPVINGYYLKTHFSDNVIWLETLATYWGLPARTPGRGASTSLPAQPKGNTWAWGGSEAAFGSVQPVGVSQPIPNLIKEVQQYLAVNTPKEKTLYTIWAGADNLLVGKKSGPIAAKKAVAKVSLAIRLLAKKGAVSFAVFNLPKLGDTPAAQANLPLKLAADTYTHYYNKFLKEALANVRKDLGTSVKIYFVDVFSELNLVVETVKNGGTYVPEFFVPGPPVAIDDVTNEALEYFNIKGKYPTGYLFWDDVHPTTQGHQVIAGLVIRATSFDK